MQFISPQELEHFFTPWYDTTFLIVKYTCQENMKETSKLHCYWRDEKGHTEEQFINHVTDGWFDGCSQFELYSNYTPCAWREEPHKVPCCDALEDALIDGTLQALKIYYVFKYTKGEDPTYKLERLRKKNCSTIPLRGEKLKEFISLLPTEKHKEACRRAYEKYKQST